MIKVGHTELSKPVIRQIIEFVHEDEFLGLVFPGKEPPFGFRSSIHSAAARAGIRISVAVQGPLAYVRRVDTALPEEKEAKKADIKCKVCKKIILPKPGTARQHVHAGKGNKKSQCQKIWRYAKAHPGITVEEAKARYYRRRRGK